MPRQMGPALLGLLCVSWVAAAPPVDLLRFYNASSLSREAVLAGFDPASAVPLDEVRQSGWGYRSLVVAPTARPGKLAAFEQAAPLGFSRAHTDATVRIALRRLPTDTALFSGLLEPSGLRFQHRIVTRQTRELQVPIPAASLPVGDYSLKLCLRVGETTECADLPLVIGPHMQAERFHAYMWDSGASTEAALQKNIRWAKLAGLNVLDSPFQPAVSALREGLWVSAHHVTLYGPEVREGYAAVAPYTEMAQAQAEALAVMARRYRHLRWCIPNSEYGSDRMLSHPASEAALKQATGVGYDGLRLASTDPPVPAQDLPAIAPGVYAHDLPEIAAHRFARRSGQGWFELNRQVTAILRQRAPWLTLWTDPVVANEQFEGFDAVSFWQYDNDPRETLVRCHRAECARRLNGARQVFLTLSQWYSGVAGAKEGWGLKSPDQHRFEGWLTLCCPVNALGYWEISQLEANPDCAAGVRDMVREVLYPYGTLLGEAKAPPAPVAVYVSTTGEFLGRAHRPLNFWFFTHYLRGVLPALFERFQYRVDWIDDQDVLAGRLGQYQLVLCPLFTATTDTLLAKLQAYQAQGGLLAGDEFWGVSGLTPSSVFPGKLPSAYGIPYANADLPRWHQANREGILQWQPTGLPPLEKLVDGRVSAPDVFTAVKAQGGVKYVILANGRFQRGAFAAKHGYTGEDYRDQGVAQEVDLWVQAPAAAALYDLRRSRRVPAAEYHREGASVRLRVPLAAAGGALYAVHPQPVARLTASTGSTRPVPGGTLVTLQVTLTDARRRPLAGRSAVQVTLRDAKGTVHDASGCYPVAAGQAQVSFGIPLGAPAGEWRLEFKDLTSGLTTTCPLKITRRAS